MLNNLSGDNEEITFLLFNVAGSAYFYIIVVLGSSAKFIINATTCLLAFELNVINFSLVVVYILLMWFNIVFHS